MSNDERFLSNFGGLRANDLNHVLNKNNSDSLDGEPMTFKHSSYIDDDELIDQLKTKHNTFTILILNCQSLNAKLYKIKILDRISHPNDNYNTLDNVIQRCKDAYLPTKIYNKHRHKKIKLDY